jgi:hypothetical protein
LESQSLSALYNHPVNLRKPHLSLVLLIFLFTAVCKPASAYDWRTVTIWNSDYGVNATLESNDNFRLTESDPIETTATSVGVFADLEGTTEASSIRFIVGASATRYSESSIEDSDDYYLSLETARRGERWSGTLDLSIAQESTTETELLDTGRVVDGERIKASIAPGVNYQLDERNSIYGSLAITDVTYDTVALTEYFEYTTSAGWVNQLSETSEVSLNGSVYDYDPDGCCTSTITSVNIGYGFNTSEATRYNFQLGTSERDNPSGTDRDRNSSFEIMHSIDDRNSFALFAGNGYVGSGAGEARYENRLNLRWDHALAERMQFTLTGEGVSTNENNRDYFAIMAGGSHQYTQELSFAGNLRYRTQQSDTFDADSTSVLFTLSYSPI